MRGLGLSDAHPRRRSDDGLTGAPWPVRAIVTIGVVGSIACFSVWVLADQVRGYQVRTEPVINATAVSTSTAAAALERAELNHRESNQRIERILERIFREICVQNARGNIQEQRQCVQ